MPGNVRRSTRIKINRESQAADKLGTSKRAHETDPEDDYDEKPQKKRVKSGSTKKKKQQSTIVAPAKPRKRRGASLSMMVEQPIDIILTICQFIATPRDFVSLMQVSHAFFNLLSSHAIGKWTDLRAEFKTPDPLPGMSEVEWAMLLLGEPRCEVCGRKNKLHVHPIFMFRKRLCGTCFKYRAINQIDIRADYYRDLAYQEIFGVVPHMTLGYERVSNWYYSREEVEKVLKDLKRLRSKPYAATSAYLLSGRKSRDEKNNLYQHAWDWICDYKGREDDEVCGVRSNAIQQRLIELGYRETHVEIISASVTFRKPKVVNDREWENIKEKVLDEMKNHRVQLVLQDPFVADFTTRSGLMRAAHTQFKKSLAPGTWINQPPIERISKFSRVLELLIAPDDVVWTTQDFVDAIESHRSDIEQWGVSVTISSGVSHTGINYLAQRSLGQDFTGEYPKMHDNAYYSPNHAEDCNQLAVYQFQCCYCYPTRHEMILSLDVAFNHNDCQSKCKTLELIPGKPSLRICSPHYVQIQILYLTGMDISTTTVDEMDNRGDIFRCLECAVSTDPERQSRSIATWRECVLRHRHIWIDPDSIKFELVREKMEDDRKFWTCACCNVHVDALVTRREVYEHLLNVHAITNPSLPEHFRYAGKY